MNQDPGPFAGVTVRKDRHTMYCGTAPGTASAPLTHFTLHADVYNQRKTTTTTTSSKSQIPVTDFHLEHVRCLAAD